MSRTLYVTCPAYALHGPLDRQKVQESATWFAKEFGLEVVTSPLLDRHMGQGAWLPQAERQADLERAIDHTAIWACRGGFGSIHLVEGLLKLQPATVPFLIGYSDITVLHTAWHMRGWQLGCYGTIPHRTQGRSGATLFALAHGQGWKRSQAGDPGVRVLRAGRAEGPLFPACLSVLASLSGTAVQPDLRGRILAIEDVDVHPFLVDTYLNQLHLAGVLEGVAGLTGGSFTSNERVDYVGPSSDDILEAWGERLRIPTIARLPYGHLEDPLVLPYGRTATLTARRSGVWSLAVAPSPDPMPWA